MGFGRVNSQRLYESIVAAIKDAILRGVYTPGDRLPTERELFDTFGVSRATLREAFRVLEAENIIFSRQGGGRYVRTPVSDTMFRVTTSIRPPEKQAILHLTEARETIESKTAALAARYATKEEKKILEDIVAAIMDKDNDENSIPDLFDLDLKFHLHIAEAARNPVYVNWLDMSMQKLQESRQRMLFLPKRRLTLGKELRMVFDAIQEGNARGAAKAMSAHMQAIIKKLQSIPDA